MPRQVLGQSLSLCKSMKSKIVNSIIVCLLFAVISLGFCMPAQAAVPRWAYDRGTVSSCNLGDAMGAARSSLIAAGLPNVQQGSGDVYGGWDNDNMVLVFLTDVGQSRAFTVVATGNSADSWRDKVTANLRSSVIIDCGPVLNPI